ncbi:MAG: NAD-dependent epimerase/dehydratase family protein [Candidatus Riflebacteria bacterium]|nr:NAD-dependent epimerase/dehydratase family protein [Candidatus Riflebacteria bacterium]
MDIRKQEITREDCATLFPNGPAALAGLRGETLLVTGGTGFVGTWLAELGAWLNDEHGFGLHMILLSRQESDFAGKAPHLAGRKDIRLLKMDVRNVQEFPPEVTLLVHAAGTPDNRFHATDPLSTMDIFVRGCRSVLNAAARLPALKRVLHLSSGLVCGGQPLDLPRMPESFAGRAEFGSVASCYTESKRMAETVCAGFRSQHRLPIVVARPFAFIGPYQLLDRPWAINNFVRDALLGGPIRIQGDGETVRSYLYGADLACWLYAMLLEGQIGHAYNVGSPEPVTLKDLADLIADQLSRRPKIERNLATASRFQATRFVPDVTLAESTLGLQRRFPLLAAIRRTIAWNQAQA